MRIRAYLYAALGTIHWFLFFWRILVAQKNDWMVAGLGVVACFFFIATILAAIPALRDSEET